MQAEDSISVYGDHREYHWRRAGIVGMTIDRYNLLVEAQNDRCAGCGAERYTRVWMVDHDHETGEVLGLVCAVCNRNGVLH
jgi:recombination endonuclease VII